MKYSTLFLIVKEPARLECFTIILEMKYINARYIFFVLKIFFLNMELSMTKAFKSGVNEYLEKFKFKNTVSEDLWIALSNASKKPVKEIMEMWTKQTGFPAITVNIRA
jgi:hypothetical protein